MGSNDNLKESNIENRKRYYFDDLIKIEDFNFGKILIDEKIYKNILVYNVSHKTLIYDKPLRIRFNKINGFIMSLLWN